MKRLLIGVLALAACTSEPKEEAALEKALEAKFVHVDFEVDAQAEERRLVISADDSTLRKLPDAPLKKRGEEFAKFALLAWPHPALFDTVTVQFIREKESGILSSTVELSEFKYLTKDLK